jgi:hypothetical protein
MEIFHSPFHGRIRYVVLDFRIGFLYNGIEKNRKGGSIGEFSPEKSPGCKTF